MPPGGCCVSFTMFGGRCGAGGMMTFTELVQAAGSESAASGARWQDETPAARPDAGWLAAVRLAPGRG